MKDKKEKKSRKLLVLFLNCLYLSAFTFGGGYVIVTLMKNRFVDKYKWIDDDEMLDLTAIAQSAPGAIAVNAAIVTGYKIAGIAGAAVAIIGTIIPPFIIITVISFFYEKFKANKIIHSLLSGMQAGVGAVIASVCTDLGADVVKEKNVLNDIIMITAFVLSFFLNVNVVYIIIACILIGIIRAVINKKKDSVSEARDDLS